MIGLLTWFRDLIFIKNKINEDSNDADIIKCWGAQICKEGGLDL